MYTPNSRLEGKIEWINIHHGLLLEQMLMKNMSEAEQCTTTIDLIAFGDGKLA